MLENNILAEEILEDVSGGAKASTTGKCPNCKSSKHSSKKRAGKTWYHCNICGFEWKK